MHARMAGETADCWFDLPPRVGAVERRMAGMALHAWAVGGRAAVPGFDDNRLTIADPAGQPCVTAAAPAITAIFGLAPGMVLSGRHGLAAELLAACDLIALQPRAVPFEASLAAPGRALILVRGVALPLFADGRDTDLVQIIVSWREVLNRAATTRLRRELGAAFRFSAPISAISDPFAAKSTS